eukprot:6180241-Pleurochrysis_carterae.AAC.1
MSESDASDTDLLSAWASLLAEAEANAKDVALGPSNIKARAALLTNSFSFLPTHRLTYLFSRPLTHLLTPSFSVLPSHLLTYLFASHPSTVIICHGIANALLAVRLHTFLQI